MAVRWPDGSVTGSLLREPAAAAPAEPEPDKQPEPKGTGKKEVSTDGDR